MSDKPVAWRSVPTEPTEEMLSALHAAVEVCAGAHIHRPLEFAYKAMLAAAPQSQEPLTDEQIDALDTFSLSWLAPQGKESVRAFARAILAAAQERKP